MFHVYLSNRAEKLFDCLAGIVSAPLSSPFTRDTIIVQNAGLRQWLSIRLAKRFGITAGIEFPFPNRFIRDLARLNLPGSTTGSDGGPESMVWQVMDIIGTTGADPRFDEVGIYLDNDESEIKRFALSARIADLFEQYLVFRPDLVDAWEHGAQPSDTTEAWQAALWRQIAAGEYGADRRRIQRELIACIYAARNIPERLSVFGVSALPPFHMELLDALARRIDIHFFLVSPCNRFWGYARSKRDLAREAQKNGMPLDEFMAKMHHEPSNSLLTSMGGQIQVFSSLLPDNAEHDEYEEPPRGSLLLSIQNDIWNQIDITDPGREPPPVPAADRSVQVHSCHGPLREMEVLHDRLLDIFDSSRGATAPHDVVVMTPDIEAMTPYIQAVFDSANPRIRYSIADRSAGAENSVYASLGALFDAVGSRFGVSRILAVFECAPVRAQFSLSEQDVSRIAGIAAEAAVRWGVDAETCGTRFGVPQSGENTWRHGIDRLVLGFALPQGQGGLFSGRLPVDNIEGERMTLTGTLSHVVELLADAAEKSAAPLSVGEWADFSRELLERFVSADSENADEYRAVSRAISACAGHAADARFDSPVSIQVFRKALDNEMKVTLGAGRFSSGGVTFCGIVPMRPVPFKVVCMTGMDDEKFPRSRRAPGFDLIARNPRPGDRIRRGEDRYLFLEALLSAREIFYISYSGFDCRDGTRREPSVAVSELREYVDEGYACAVPLVTEHPLQPFSRRYFDKSDSALFSYSREYCEAAARLDLFPAPSQPPFKSPLSAPPGELLDISIDDFCRFFGHPAKFFLSRRFPVRALQENRIPEDYEPFVVAPLERYTIKQTALSLVRQNQDFMDALKVLRASGMLPGGTEGDRIAAEIFGAARLFNERVNLLCSGAPLAMSIDITTGKIRITGKCDNIRNDAMIVYRFSKMKPKDQLSAWIRHIVLNTQEKTRTVICCEDKELEYPAFDSKGKASAILAQLADLYYRGLCNPLRFFPVSSLAYAEAMRKKPDPADACARAQKKWEGSLNHSGDMLPGEGDDEWYQIAFHDDDPFSEDFGDIAVTVYGALLEELK